MEHQYNRLEETGHGPVTRTGYGRHRDWFSQGCDRFASVTAKRGRGRGRGRGRSKPKPPHTPQGGRNPRTEKTPNHRAEDVFGKLQGEWRKTDSGDRCGF